MRNREGGVTFRLERLCTVAALFALIIGTPNLRADELFKGKTIKLFIGSGAGGGYDLFGRLVSRHIGDYLPGRPSVLPENMPGAGSVVMTNYLYNVTPKDGLSIGIASPSLALIDAVGTPGVRFHVGKLNWIGRISAIRNVLVTWRGSKIKSIRDAQDHVTLISAISATSPLTLLPEVLNATAGTKFKFIQGYADSASTLLAMERGEVDGTTASWATLTTLKSDWLKTNSINVLVQFSLSRSRDLPNAPAATEVTKSPDDKRLMSLFVSGADVGYSIFTSPGVAPEVIASLRDAFDKMIADPIFQRDAKSVGIELDAMSGADVQKLVESTATLPEKIRDRARETSNPQ
jgi:tripartite-type tricarboxylate transporter receptor subunit TctC